MSLAGRITERSRHPQWERPRRRSDGAKLDHPVRFNDPISYARHRFPPDVIRHAVWLYLRFTLSYRDVEDLLVERGLEVSNETIRRWVLKFGPAFARSIRRGRPTPHGKWHLDEMVVSIAGRRMYMWR